MSRRRTTCFNCQRDDLDATAAAHNDPTVIALATLVIEHPELLKDLSLELLRNVPVRPPGSARVSRFYRKRKGRAMLPEERQLADLLDQMYSSTQDQVTLDHLRGIILERIVFNALSSRRVRGDEVIDNVSHLGPPGMQWRPINDYSVDVAGCFPSRRGTEFYACKLRSAYIEDDALARLDGIGAYFEPRCASVITAACCLDTDVSIDEDTEELLRSFPDIGLYTADSLSQLLKDPAGQDSQNGHGTAN